MKSDTQSSKKDSSRKTTLYTGWAIWCLFLLTGFLTLSFLPTQVVAGTITKDGPTQFPEGSATKNGQENQKSSVQQSTQSLPETQRKELHNAVLHIQNDAEGFRYLGGRWVQIKEDFPHVKTKANWIQITSPIAWGALLISYICLVFGLGKNSSRTQLVPSGNQSRSRS